MVDLCINCFNKKGDEEICPHCGYAGELPEDVSLLPAGTKINNRYILGKVLGRGGFGVSYLAYDTKLSMKVCIKEYFPGSISNRAQGTTAIVPYTGEAATSYKYGRQKFLEEGKTLAKFNSIASIVSVNDFFTENSTAYIVMEFLDGVNLATYLNIQLDKKLSWDKTIKIISPILDVLSEIHTEGLIHRDLSPDNIFITKQNNIKLLDFGAARYAFGEHAKSMSVILKHGYAPPEQYSRTRTQGPWTDVYAICATIYKCLTGKTPPDSMDRLVVDDLAPPSQLGSDIPQYAEKALMKGLEVNFDKRWQSIKNVSNAFKKKIEANQAITVMDNKTVNTVINSININNVHTRNTMNINNHSNQEDNIQNGKKNKNTNKILIAITAIAIIIAIFAILNKSNQYEIPEQISVANQETTASPSATAEILSSENDSLNTIKDNIMLDAGNYHTVGLKSNSTVYAAGSNGYGQCNTGSWSDITAVSAGGLYTVGLKSNGTVVSAGDNTYGQCNTGSWSDIVSLKTGTVHTVGLKNDGTVIAIGKNDQGQCNVNGWSDITTIACGYKNTIGLKDDGTVVAVGYNEYGQCNVSSWNDIIAISAGRVHTLGLKSDGTVVCAGRETHSQCYVHNWNDIVAISAGDYHTIGLKSDGSVLAVGFNENGQCNVDSWKNIVAISAGYYHSVGIKKDGSVVSTGSNEHSQCDVNNWVIDISEYQQN